MFYGFDGGVFGRDEDGAWDFHVEFFGVVALVDGYADAASRVDVEKGVAYRDVHEGLAVREGYGLFVDLDWDSVAHYVTQFLEIFARDIRDQGAEGVVQTD